MPIGTMLQLVERIDAKFGSVDTAVATKLGTPTAMGAFDPTLIDLSLGQLTYRNYAQQEPIAFSLDPSTTPTNGSSVSVNITGGGFAVTFASPFLGLDRLTSGAILQTDVDYAFLFSYAKDWEEVAPGGVFEDRVLVVASGGLLSEDAAVQITPEQFGAVGDGTANDANAFDDAIAEAVISGRLIKGHPGRTYRIGTSLAKFTGTLRIQDCTFKAPNGVYVLRGEGGWGNENTTLTSMEPVAAGGSNVATRINLTSTAGLQIGDWVSVGSSTTQWPSANDVWWFEAAEIESLVANTSITLNRRLLGESSGLVTDDLTLFKMPNYRLEARNLRFVADGNVLTSGQTGRVQAIVLHGGVGHLIENCHAESWWQTFISLRSCVLSEVLSCSWALLPDLPLADEAFGYGIHESGACYGNHIVSFNGGQCRHGYTSSGAQRATYPVAEPWYLGVQAHTTISASKVTGCTHAAFDTHAECYGTIFQSCHASDPSVLQTGTPHAFQNRGFGTRFAGCSCVGGRRGLVVLASADLTTIGANRLSVDGFYAAECTQAAIFFEDTEPGTTAVFHSLTSVDCPTVFHADAGFTGQVVVRSTSTLGLTGALIVDDSAGGVVWDLDLEDLDPLIGGLSLAGFELVDDLAPPHGVTPLTVGDDVDSIVGGGSVGDIWTAQGAGPGELTLNSNGAIQTDIVAGNGSFMTGADRSLDSDFVTVAFASWTNGVTGDVLSLYDGTDGFGFRVILDDTDLRFRVYTAPATIADAIAIPIGELPQLVVAAISYDRANQVIRWAANIAGRYGDVTGVAQAAPWNGVLDLVGHAFGQPGSTSTVDMIHYGAVHYTSDRIATRAELQRLVREMGLRYIQKLRPADVGLGVLTGFLQNPLIADADLGGHGVFNGRAPRLAIAGTAYTWVDADRGKDRFTTNAAGCKVTVAGGTTTGLYAVRDACPLTPIANAVWGTPSGANVTITGTGFPVVPTGNLFAVLSHSVARNEGLYRATGTPTSTSLPATKISGTPAAAVAEAIQFRPVVEIVGDANVTLNGVTTPSIPIAHIDSADGRAFVSIDTNSGTTPIGVAGGDLDLPIDLGGIELGNLKLRAARETGAIQSGVTGGITLDYDNAHYHKIVHGAGNISSVTLADWPLSGDMGWLTVDYVQDGTGGRTVVHPSGIVWAGGVPTFNTAASKTNRVTYTSVDGAAVVVGHYSGAW